MPALNWIGKEGVVKHHKEVPFRLLEAVPQLSCGFAESGNLIVQFFQVRPKSKTSREPSTRILKRKEQAMT